MKKKNQELEKFKFVLDYKIKELKKQIEPRENDIKAMKEQIQEVNDLFLFFFVLFLYVKKKTVAYFFLWFLLWCKSRVAYLERFKYEQMPLKFV